MATEVGEHCNCRGKPNHQLKDCTSGHTPKHPDFNEEGKWVGCASYKTVKAWLAAHNRSGEHPTLRFNFRADGTPMVLKPKAKSDRPSERDSRSNPADSSSSGPTTNRGTTSEETEAQCTLVSARTPVPWEVRVSCRPQ